MASLADRQAVTIISTIHGTIKILLEDKRFSRIDMVEKLEELNSLCARIRDSWSPNYTNKDIDWTVVRIASWSEGMNNLDIPATTKTNILVKIAIMAGSDLLQKVNNRHKISSIATLVDGLEVFDNFIDSRGTAFTSMEQADSVLSCLYNEIEFKP